MRIMSGSDSIRALIASATWDSGSPQSGSMTALRHAHNIARPQFPDVPNPGRKPALSSRPAAASASLVLLFRAGRHARRPINRQAPPPNDRGDVSAPAFRGSSRKPDQSRGGGGGPCPLVTTARREIRVRRLSSSARLSPIMWSRGLALPAAN